MDEFQINFNKESKAGDTIDFYIANPEENRYLIEGKRENESIFQTAITFK